MKMSDRPDGATRIRIFVAGFALLLGVGVPAIAPAQALKSYNVKLDETSVSGISSGAYMAVQFAVAHSAIIKGVGATAGGPYFCAESIFNRELTTSRVLRRCMQGDPDFPSIPITPADVTHLIRYSEEFAAKGKIDAVSNLARQKIWLFHGYNDGVVKKPVSDALYSFYIHYVGSQAFYKDNVPAGHAQVIDRCPIGERNATPLLDCDCRKTGDVFIKNCAYDAAGSLLRHIYGDLKDKAPTPHGELKTFSQDEFALDRFGRKNAHAISMGRTGYVYVPAKCSDMTPCRVHVALHGCQQYGDKIGDRFARYAGYNEWADTNDIIVLYPQATQSPSVDNPFVLNPQGCWDWWGYNQQTDAAGIYATKAGLQISAIMRMLDRLAGAYSGWQAPASHGPFAVTDFTDRQVALRWGHVARAVSYNLYRADSSDGPFARINMNGPITSDVYVDATTASMKTYFYMLKGIDSAGQEMSGSRVMVRTAQSPPPCDPYFSIVANRSVTKTGGPTAQACP